MINKVKAIFICFLVISLSIVSAISLSSINASAYSFPFVQAQQYGWCLETKDGKTCQLTYSDQCNSSVFPQRPNDCRAITCILSDGKCMEDVPYKTCIKEYGGKEDMGNLCARGCCGVANRSYGIKTYAECLKIAEQKGYNKSYIQWYGGLTNERECSLKFDLQERGCCVTDTCSYTTKGDCQGEFVRNTYCYQITKCYVQEHFKLGCGVMDGDEQKICWFDNLGNQEECIDKCDYPAFVCSINNVEGYKLKQGEKGYNWSKGNATQVNSNKVIQVFGVYCKSTTCDLSDAKGSQKLRWEKGELKIGKLKIGKLKIRELKIRELKIEPEKLSSLLSGHSICYNFYTIDSKKDKEGAISFNGHDFPARSTGLQNQIIRCVNGEVILEGLGVDRKNLCFEAEDVSTYVEENKYELCFEPRCGGEGVWDTIYDFFAAGFHGSMGLWSLPVMGVAKGLGGDKVGSCTEKVCEEKKFLNGESYCEFNTYALIDSACVPRYPPGTKDYCRKCRDTGDHIFNFCERSEAYALGDCMWEPYSSLDKIMEGFITYILLFLSIWYGLIWLAALIDSISECGGLGIIFCFVKNLFVYTKHWISIVPATLIQAFVWMEKLINLVKKASPKK
jgi:hypothetical protein